MVWEDVEFLGDVGSRLKHVLNTTRPVHRLSNLLSPSPSLRDLRRMEEYFDVEGDRKEFVMARKVVFGIGSSAGPPFSDRKSKLVGKGTTTTTIDTATAIIEAIETPIQVPLLRGSIGNGEDFSDEDSIFFPCYDHLPSTIVSSQPSLQTIVSTIKSGILPDRHPSPALFSTSSSVQPHDSFISLSNDTVDDSYLQHPPTQHVDYLSHDWREEDLSASWRFNMSNRRDDKDEEKKNRARLLNASWRRWGMTRFDLDTLPAEKIQWIKDDDLTWLYGPIQISKDTTTTRDPQRTRSLDLYAPRDTDFEAELIQSPNFPPNLPPQLPESSILRIPTLEQVLLQRSAFELALNRHLPPSTSLESSRSSLSRRSSVRHSSPDNQPSTSSNSDISQSSSSQNNVKRVSFHSEVLQAVKINTHTNSDERLMTLQQLRQSRNISNQKQHRQSSEPLIHESIEPTSLAQPGPILPRAGESSATGALGVYGALTGSFFTPTAKPGNVLPYADAPITKPLQNSRIASHQKSLKKGLGPIARAEIAACDAFERVDSAVKRKLPCRSYEVQNPADEVNAQSEEGCCIPKANCRVMSIKLEMPLMPLEMLTDEEYFEYEMFGLPKARSNILHTPPENDFSQEAEEKQAAVFNDFSIQQRYPASSSHENGFGQMQRVTSPLEMDDEEYWFMNV